jgi:hypothetical protein
VTAKVGDVIGEGSLCVCLAELKPLHWASYKAMSVDVSVGRWLRVTLIVWVVSMAIGFALTRSVHAGPLLYDLFVIIAWPLLYFAEHETMASLTVSAIAQLVYAGVTVGCVRLFRWSFDR